MSEELVELLPVIEAIAPSVARGYPGVDKDDLYQELCVWVLENGHRLDLGHAAGCRYILNRAAHIFCKRERAAQLQRHSQYNYRPADVRKMLEAAMSGDPLERLDTHVPADAASAKETGTDGLDLAMDVRVSADSLPEADQKSIYGRYVLGVVPEADSAERKRLDRAVDRLTDELNSYSSGRLGTPSIAGHPGSRRARSNASALAALEV